LVYNSLSRFSVFLFFLVGGSVVPLAKGILGYFLALLLLFIYSCIGIIKSIINNSILFVVSCFGFSITSGDNSYIISASIGLIG
jgi:hypothetical protein